MCIRDSLVDHADPQVLRRTRVRDLDLFALVENRARILGVDAGKDFHHRRFAGAVFAHKGVHLASAQLELRLVQGLSLIHI